MVTVEDVISDGRVDDVALCIAVVNEVQNYPFGVYVGEKIVSKQNVGKYMHL